MTPIAKKDAPRMTSDKHKSIKSYFHHQYGLSGGKAGRNLILLSTRMACGAGDARFRGKDRIAGRGTIQRIVFLKTSRSFSHWDGSSVNSLPVKGVFKNSL